MSQQIVHLERTWGTTDEECRTFLQDLHRQLYGWRQGNDQRAVELAVSPDDQELIIDAASLTEAWAIVTLAAAQADPAWRRLYRLTG